MKPLTAVVADFDRIADAIAAEPRPDVFTAAERFLLEHVPARARRAVDVGCGDGAMTRALAARAIATLGIDASPRMIALARARAGGSPLLEYQIGDVMAGALPPAAFDLVVSVAMAHHAPLEQVVRSLGAAVAPGGTLLLQDVTTRRGIRHLPINGLAWAARHLGLLPGGGKKRATVAALYEAHGAEEEYLLQEDVEDVYRTILPGARIYHHLEWRYTAVWTAGTDALEAATHR
jgi:2-polyprenyl-3-methyl-5-hydroxy-6-metoxy-1,4-benzoquinol methylase